MSASRRSRRGRPGRTRLSHPELELRVDRVVLAAGAEMSEQVEADDDVFVFVVAGRGEVVVGDDVHGLGTGDGIDIERAARIDLRSSGGATLLVVRASRR